MAAARPRRGGREANRPRRRHEVPLLFGPSSRQAGLARPPVPPGVRAGRDRARSVRTLRRGPCAAAQDPGARPAGARRGDPPLLDVAQRGRPAGALDRARLGGAPTPAAGARLPLRRLRRLRPVRQPARPGEEDRPAPRGRRTRFFARGRHRGGRTRTDSGSRRSHAIVAWTGARDSRVASARKSSPTSTDAASRCSTRPSTRTSGWCRSRPFSRRSPC